MTLAQWWVGQQDRGVVNRAGAEALVRGNLLSWVYPKSSRASGDSNALRKLPAFHVLPQSYLDLRPGVLRQGRDRQPQLF